MATFIPKVNFTGYPHDDKTGVKFKAGVESDEVPAAFLSLMQEKGLVGSDQDRRLLQAEKGKRQSHKIAAPKKATATKLAKAASAPRLRSDKAAGPKSNTP